MDVEDPASEVSGGSGDLGGERLHRLGDYTCITMETTSVEA